MKKFISLMLCVLFLFVCSQVNAATLKFTKVVDTEDYTIAGYNMKWGTVEGTYPSVKDIGNVDTVENIQDVCGLASNTRYYFVVTAYTLEVEGPSSNSANYLTPLGYVPPPDTPLPPPPTPPVKPPAVTITIIVDTAGDAIVVVPE